MDQVYEVWIEIQANKKLILNSEKFRETMEKCKKAGMTGIILSVKDTSGFVLYKSCLADHYSVFDREFDADTDYVAKCFGIIRDLGMKCYAAFDVFTEGNKNHRHPLMKGFKEGWQCEVYGLDEGGNVVIQKSTGEKTLKTVGEKVVAEYTITNNSKAGINATLSNPTATQTDDTAKDYYTVTATLADTNPIAPNGTKKLTVTVELVKAPLEEVTGNFTIAFNASATK